MCGRYAASRKPEDLALEFEAVPAGGQPPVAADFNVAPTKFTAVATSEVVVSPLKPGVSPSQPFQNDLIRR